MPDAWITASWDFSKIQSTIYAYLAIPGKKLNNLKKYFVNIAMIPWTLINVLNVGKEASYKYRIKMVKFQIQANVKILAHQDIIWKQLFEYMLNVWCQLQILWLASWLFIMLCMLLRVIFANFRWYKNGWNMH